MERRKIFVIAGVFVFACVVIAIVAIVISEKNGKYAKKCKKL